MVVRLVNFGRDFLIKFLTDLQQVKKLVQPPKMHVTYLIGTETPCYLQTKNYITYKCHFFQILCEYMTMFPKSQCVSQSTMLGAQVCCGYQKRWDKQATSRYSNQDCLGNVSQSENGACQFCWTESCFWSSYWSARITLILWQRFKEETYCYWLEVWIIFLVDDVINNFIW